MDRTHSIGETLAAARRAQGKSLEDVEQATKIRGRYIEALEHDQFTLIPGDVYVRGFLKTYATYLGLDPMPILELYRHGPQETARLDSKMAPTVVVKRKRAPKWVGASVGFVILGLVLLGLLIWGGGIARRPVGRRAVVEGTRSAPRIPAPAGRGGSEGYEDSEGRSRKRTVTTTTVEAEVTTVKATAIDEKGSWVRVEVDGHAVFEGILNKNESRQWSGRSIFIRAGNAKGLVLERDGRPLGPMGLSGGIAERVFSVEGIRSER